MKARRLAPLLLSWLCLGLAFGGGWYAAQLYKTRRAPEPAARRSAKALPSTPAAPERAPAPADPGAAEADSFAGLSPARVVGALGVKPGMTILEVDAAQGGFTTAFAEALGGSGRVYAASSDADTTAEIRRAGAGHTTVTALQIGAGGLESLFKGRVFDIVLLANIFEHMPDPEAFFRKLGASLRPRTGRLVLVRGVIRPAFYPFQFGEGFLRERFLQEGERFPPYRRLPERLRAALAALGPEEALGEGDRSEMAKAFEAMLDDQRLFWEVNDHHNARVHIASELMRLLPEDEIRLAQWLVLHYDGRGVFTRPWRELGPSERAAVRTLNMLTLVPYFDRTRPWPGFSSRRSLCLATPTVTAHMRRAGYRLERELEGFKAYSVLIFRPEP